MTTAASGHGFEVLAFAARRARVAAAATVLAGCGPSLERPATDLTSDTVVPRETTTAPAATTRAPMRVSAYPMAPPRRWETIVLGGDGPPPIWTGPAPVGPAPAPATVPAPAPPPTVYGPVLRPWYPAVVGAPWRTSPTTVPAPPAPTTPPVAGDWPKVPDYGMQAPVPATGPWKRTP